MGRIYREEMEDELSGPSTHSFTRPFCLNSSGFAPAPVTNNISQSPALLLLRVSRTPVQHFFYFFTNKMENNVVPLYEPASWNSHSRATCCLAQQRRTEKKKTIWKVCIYWRKRKKKEMFLFYIYIYLRQNGLVYIPTGATVLLRWLLLRLRTSTLSGRGRLNVYATISRHNPSLSPKSQKFFLLLPSLNSRRKATKKRKRKFMMMMSGGHHSREVIRPLPFVIDEGVIFSWLHTS